MVAVGVSLLYCNYNTAYSIIAVGIVEAAVWLLIDDFPKWAKFHGVAHGLSAIILGLLFMGAYNVTVKWKAFNFVRWGLGLLFIGVAVSPFVWLEKVVEVPPPSPIAVSCKDVSRQTLLTLPVDMTTLKPPQGGWIMESGTMPPDILRMRVNISTLMDCKHEVQLALVAWLEDNTTDRMTDYRIEKSNLFSPLSEQRELQMHVTEAFLRRAAPEHQVVLMLVALPARGLTPSDWSKMTTINQAVRNGGSVITASVFQLRCKCPGKKACSTSLERFRWPTRN